MSTAQLTASPHTFSFTPEAHAAHLAAHANLPAWLIERKRAAYARYTELPMPPANAEAWRFSTRSGFKLDALNPLPASITGTAGLQPGSDSLQPSAFSLLSSAASLSFLNNHLHAHTALSADLKAKGVIVASLREALHSSHADLIRTHFMSQPQKLGSEKFAALHTAFLSDGAFVYVPKNVTIANPILITHAATGPGTAVFPHTLVILEDNAQATVVDHFISADTSAHFACGANDLYAAHGAKLTYVGVQNWSPTTLSIQLNSTISRRDTRVQTLNLHLGARQARHESLSQLQAPGAFSEMLALTVANAEQEFDQRTLQIHQAPHTKSDLLYKNALLDKSRTIFSGLIIVDPDAQKTDAYQSNRNLLLSDDAEANSLPGLEIQANDVRCTHGATSARIPAEQEFYLESRGIRPAAAQALLTYGFFEEVLNRLENEQLHEALTALIHAKFEK